MKRIEVANGNALRVWGLTAALALTVFLLTRVVLLGHAVMFGGQTIEGLLPALGLGLLRDIPAAGVVASPWLIFELLFSMKWRDRLRWPLFGIYVFTLLFVAVSEGIFWDEFSVRFNFIALDYLVFTTEVIGNIKESYPVGPIIGGLAMLTLLVAWSLRRPVQKAAAAGSSVSRKLQWAWGLGLLVVVWGVAYKMAPPEFSTNTYANELADNGWRSFLWAARQNKLNYRQFYATRPDGEVMADLQRLSGHELVTASHQPVQKVA